jgi:hypothetical protein
MNTCAVSALWRLCGLFYCWYRLRRLAVWLYVILGVGGRLGYAMRHLPVCNNEAHLPLWLVFSNLRPVRVGWSLVVSAYCEANPSASWCRVAPDLHQAAPAANAVRLVLWGLERSRVKTAAVPARYTRRTITRGPMVRKKASRLQVEQIRSRSWQQCSAVALVEARSNAQRYCVTLRVLLSQLLYARAVAFRGVLAKTPVRVQLSLDTPAAAWGYV